MKLVYTEISRLTNELLSIEPITAPNLRCPFNTQPEYHAHPELELLYIISGSGNRTINGRLEQFSSGDMVLLGPGVPHIWIGKDKNENSDRHSPKAILVYFNTHKFNDLFSSLREFSAIQQLIQESRKGIKIIGQTRDEIGQELLQLHSAGGYYQIEGILRILHTISTSEDREFVSDAFPEDITHDESDKMVSILTFISDNLHTTITLEQLAAIADMSGDAFCRFFRGRMKKNFSQYLQEQRMQKACSLLSRTGYSISDISDLCGYRSPSHFSQVFKSKYNKTPFEYRRIAS